jgi:hypothetical protein
VLTKGKIVEWVSKIELRPDIRPKERKQYEDLLRKYIHLFVFSYKDLRESLWSNTKSNCYQMPNRLGPSKGGGIQGTLQW